MSRPDEKDMRYYEGLVNRYLDQTTSLLDCQATLAQEKIDCLIELVSKSKDERLRACVLELVSWTNKERSELGTLIAVGFEAMKLCGHQQLREAAIKAELQYRRRRVEKANSSSDDRREEPRVPAPGQSQAGWDPVPDDEAPDDPEP